MNQRKKMNQCLQIELNFPNGKKFSGNGAKILVCLPTQYLFLKFTDTYIKGEVIYRQAHWVVKYLKLKRNDPSIKHREIVYLAKLCSIIRHFVDKK